MSKVIASLVVAAAVLYAVVLAEAQQARKIQRIGYISGRSGPGPLDEVFKTALRELGYVEGQNISITYDGPRKNWIDFPHSRSSWFNLKSTSS